MALVVAGIDEAGYGPLLGPLCVGMTVFRVRDWRPGDPSPNLWRMLSGAVCRKAADKRRRIAIDDSKKLKLANSSQTLHPLTHLERGVLAAIGAASDRRPRTDQELFGTLGVECEPHPWYHSPPVELPLGAGDVDLRANALRRAMSRAGVELLAVRCLVVCEDRFNRTIESEGTKAATTGALIREHLRTFWSEWCEGADRDCPPRLVCDRQGGRLDYAELLAGGLQGVGVTMTHRSAESCRYELHGRPSGRDADGHLTALFMPEAESEHLPVALASMTAKLTRELLMNRFNTYWAGLLPELKPTAGYRNDAWRWLDDTGPVLTPDVRRVLVRRA